MSIFNQNVTPPNGVINVKSMDLINYCNEDLTAPLYYKFDNGVDQVMYRTPNESVWRTRKPKTVWTVGNMNSRHFTMFNLALLFIDLNNESGEFKATKFRRTLANSLMLTTRQNGRSLYGYFSRVVSVIFRAAEAKGYIIGEKMGSGSKFIEYRRGFIVKTSSRDDMINGILIEAEKIYSTYSGSNYSKPKGNKNVEKLPMQTSMEMLDVNVKGNNLREIEMSEVNGVKYKLKYTLAKPSISDDTRAFEIMNSKLNVIVVVNGKLMFDTPIPSSFEREIIECGNKLSVLFEFVNKANKVKTLFSVDVNHVYEEGSDVYKSLMSITKDSFKV